MAQQSVHTALAENPGSVWFPDFAAALNQKDAHLNQVNTSDPPTPEEDLRTKPNGRKSFSFWKKTERGSRSPTNSPRKPDSSVEGCHPGGLLDTASKQRNYKSQSPYRKKPKETTDSASVSGLGRAAGPVPAPALVLPLVI